MAEVLSRRNVLAGISATTFAGLAGCLSEIPGFEGNEEEEVEEAVPTIDANWAMYGSDPHNTFYTNEPGPTDQPAVAWSFDTEPFMPVDPVPVIGNETVFLPDSREETDSDLLALSVDNGEERWGADLEQNFGHRLTPALYDGGLYAASREFFSLDPDTGEVRWQVDSEDLSRSEFLCIGSNTAVYGGTQHVLTVDLADQSVRWEFQPQARPLPPAITDDAVYFGSRSADDGFLAAYSGEDGSELWFEDNFAHGGASAPAVANGSLYFGDSFDAVAIEHESGTERWRRELGGTVANPPALDSGSVYYPGTGSVARFDAENGERVWMEEFDTGFTPGVLTPELFYTGSSEGIVYAFDRADGSIVWHYDLDTSLAGAPALGNETLFFGDRDGVIYALR